MDLPERNKKVRDALKKHLAKDFEIIEYAFDFMNSSNPEMPSGKGYFVEVKKEKDTVGFITYDENKYFSQCYFKEHEIKFRLVEDELTK